MRWDSQRVLAGAYYRLQYFATLLSRPHAGRYADVLGRKNRCLWLRGCFGDSGYLLADIASARRRSVCCYWGWAAFVIGQSFAGTGSTLVGRRRRRVVAYWSGHSRTVSSPTGAMAMGAPLGVCYARGLQGPR